MSHWRKRLYRIIFQHDTWGGRAFDVTLLAMILASVFAVVLESVASIRARWGEQLYGLEWGFTFLFSVEYILRLICHPAPLRYARSFYGAIDFIAILPTYLSLLIPGAQSLLVIRALRLLRVFRILKMGQYVGEARVLGTALRRSRQKIIVFLTTVITITIIVGAAMYLLEGEENGFTSIPIGVYWAVVTMTTVGYGDVAPHTPAGKALATMLMILGYGIIAIPTGIVTVELTNVSRATRLETRCPGCGVESHDWDASYCKICGTKLAQPRA
jgi:voltage-gated potassium channel